MRSVNYAIRKATVTALTGITYNSIVVPVYYMEAPEANTATNYIIIEGLSSFDESTKSSSEVDTDLRLTIHTFSDNMNSGLAADSIASSILTAIYPNKQTRLNLSADSMQCTNCRLQSDNTQEYSIQGTRKYITRTITFVLKVFMY